MFTLIKEEVNSTFLPFDKFIDHRCCERVLSVFKPSAGQTEQRRFKPQINFRPSLFVLLGNPWCGARSHLLLHQGSACFRLTWMFFGSYGCFSDGVFFIFCRQVGPTSNLSGSSFLYLYQAAIFCCHPHHLLYSQYNLVLCPPKESSRGKISLTISFWAFLLFQCSEGTF